MQFTQKPTLLRKLLLLGGVITFLIILSSCAHTFGHHVQHNESSDGAVCDTLAQLSNSVIVKETLVFALLFLLVSAGYVGQSFFLPIKLPEKLIFLYKILHFRRILYRIFDPILEALRRGILHPKLYNTPAS